MCYLYHTLRTPKMYSSDNVSRIKNAVFMLTLARHSRKLIQLLRLSMILDGKD